MFSERVNRRDIRRAEFGQTFQAFLGEFVSSDVAPPKSILLGTNIRNYTINSLRYPKVSIQFIYEKAK
jgi:hypothetical protein